MEVQVINEGPKITNTKVGDILKVREEDEDGVKSTVEYKVTNVYPYQLMAMTRRGRKKRFFSYGDLVKMGLESQSQETVACVKAVSGRKGARYTYTRTAQYGGNK